jgi:3-dehydroquinate synthase
VKPSKIHIDLHRAADKSYDILIGIPLSRAIKDIVRRSGGGKAFVITDSNVVRHYGGAVGRGMRARGKQCKILVVPAGEKSKSRKIKERLENQLLFAGAGRDSLIIALGGGMVGDLAGFVAATLFRGVRYVQIPTTLLAQVDSSVGGKVAVDHPLGKNLLGAFYQPDRVYIDRAFLKTLPPREIRNGMSEIVKYAAILDRRLFSLLESLPSGGAIRESRSILNIIRRCCVLKKRVIEQDEREADLRRILNFGHTIGHALESLSRYRMSHGEAVARGMVLEARIAAGLGMISQKEVTRLEQLIRKFGLPAGLPARYDLHRIFSLTLRDKKARGGVVEYTLLEKIGKGVTGVRLSPSRARSLYRAGLSARTR